MSRAGRVPAGVAVTLTRSGAIVSLAVAFLALTGCDYFGGESKAATNTVSGTLAPKPATADSEMVAAVSSSRPGESVVDMRFAITKRPKVGEPVEVEVALTPSVPLERLFARFQGADGLQIVSGAQTESLENAPARVPIGHKVMILPNADGIFYITATVIADSEKESVSRIFHIPLVAGEGLAPPPAAANVAESPRER